MYKAANCTECICREINRNLSLIDCLEADSAFQNFLWSILIRKRLKSIVLWWSSKSIFSDTNQGRLWRTKVSVGTKQRSRSNRSSSIYKICFLFSAIPLYIRRNNRLTFKQSYREVSYWGCQKKGWLYIDNLISGGENSE